MLRIGMAVFLAAWGVDKLVATAGAQNIFSRFYLLDLGASVLQLVGVLEVGLALLLAVGALKVPIAWTVLVINGLSTLASWKEILDPWGLLGLTEGGRHLFLASIVIMAASIVLVVEAHKAARSEEQEERPPT